MAIKKARVNLLQIANVTPLELSEDLIVYPIRFRLTSDDKNRKSQWSPVYLVVAPPGVEVLYQNIDGGDNIAN
jgi:hypothetical protein